VAPDADSSEIIAHTTTDQDAGDASQVEPLLNQIDGPIGQFTADGAYDGKPRRSHRPRYFARMPVPIRMAGGADVLQWLETVSA